MDVPPKFAHAVRQMEDMEAMRAAEVFRIPGYAPMICRTCRWWEPVHEAEDEWDFSDRPDGEQFAKMQGWCILSPLDPITPEQQRSKCRAADASHYAATLWTAPDFGCNQWEPKE